MEDDKWGTAQILLFLGNVLFYNLPIESIPAVAHWLCFVFPLYFLQAMTLMEYLIKTGSERVAQQCRENIYAVQTLKDFQYIDRDGKDQVRKHTPMSHISSVESLSDLFVRFTP